MSLPRVYGPGPETTANPVTKTLRQALQNGFAFIPAHTEAVGSYTFIEDVVEGHLLALEKGKPGAKYILGGPNATYAELFQTLASVSGRRLCILPLPEGLLVGWSTVYGRMASLLGIDTQLKPATVRRLFRSYAMSSDKAVQELGYTITPLAQGIAATLQYFKTGRYATH
ncbi:hypothetical protein SAMN05444008_11791 [Cnuella takakiae]|uniref:NAD dependent epimerase/dehydratase family protein n=1 Tax=Cnuella takakiae TaxID=1302690 RepID=A0A1M5GWS0_9BACT|nr:hypothetical protein BUE76_02330 [Cnuella takakiae]SHG08173.1 hypothetical protein SAMN05444008_11791 [Cnuella takakiae]